jgi:hypothetical protein
MIVTGSPLLGPVSANWMGGCADATFARDLGNMGPITTPAFSCIIPAFFALV